MAIAHERALDLVLAAEQGELAGEEDHVARSGGDVLLDSLLQRLAAWHSCTHAKIRHSRLTSFK
jgi:hypothetical protein